MSVEFGDNVVDGLVNVELFAAEDVNECRVSVGESVNADVTLSDYHESADAPFSWIFAWPVDESVGWSNLVHSNDIRQFIK